MPAKLVTYNSQNYASTVGSDLVVITFTSTHNEQVLHNKALTDFYQQ